MLLCHTESRRQLCKKFCWKQNLFLGSVTRICTKRKKAYSALFVNTEWKEWMNGINERLNALLKRLRCIIRNQILVRHTFWQVFGDLEKAWFFSSTWIFWSFISFIWLYGRSKSIKQPYKHFHALIRNKRTLGKILKERQKQDAQLMAWNSICVTVVCICMDRRGNK